MRSTACAPLSRACQRRLQHDPRPLARPATTVKCSTRDIIQQRAVQYYEQVWSKGRVTLLDEIMTEDHEQHDMVWQPGRVGAGRRVMKRGVLAYRIAYPDLRFTVLQACCCEGEPSTNAASAASSDSLKGASGQADHTSNALDPGLLGSWVFVRWHASGTNLGPIREQPATGRSVSFAGVSHLHFDEQGRIRQSFVFRQAPDDEKAYFMAAEPRSNS